MHTSKISVTTRWSDLDTQRHVTSRTYEDFFLEGRYLQLRELGIPSDKILETRNQFRIQEFKISFYKEQNLHSDLDIISHLYLLEGGIFLWVQEALEKDSNIKACSSLTKGAFIKDLDTNLIFSGQYESIKESLDLRFNPIAQFNGNCDRILNNYTMLYSDRGMFFEYNNSSLLRILEESRWYFSTEIGLNEKVIHEMDMVTFFMGADVKVYSTPEAGEKLLTKVWIYKIDKIRLFMRIDVIRPSNNQVIISAQEEQLIVSLSKRRPRKANPDFVEKIQNLVELKDF